MGFVEDMKLLREQAEAAGRPAPPQVAEIDEDADVIAVFLKRGAPEKDDAK